MEIFSLSLLGVVAGILAGLLGVGGGVVIVPVLFWILGANAEIPAAHLMHIALGTSLATIVVTSVSSILAHHRRGAVLWPIVAWLTPGLVVGVLLGAVVADAIPSDGLRVFFAVFILLVSIQLGFNLQASPHRQLPGTVGMGIAGLIIGKLSALVGTGGGTVTVPFLLWCNTPIRYAVATSAAGGFPIALAGALGFLATGWSASGLPAWSSGYIYWPAFIAIAPVSLLFAPLGAKLAHTLPVGGLKRFFAVYLAVVGINMLLG
uniref:Probable membrane transporter protein n=1 Tax=Candidatus Kentrum sp. FM TaxID=2126340 RepID=A0A450W427_9GAMM|nr:MAG: Uncharacterized membrane protein YfcA [Candidatus Kentron sp. FM]VFJ58611.1 MAG: Uncharacterized membrane protein YfcA [Candidatus Kentron sp. FM]VFK11778.1 MAG: Uncharacterized membrane protein YfcA [Candidatus Kentron sp. FM]